MLRELTAAEFRATLWPPADLRQLGLGVSVAAVGPGFRDVALPGALVAPSPSRFTLTHLARLSRPAAGGLRSPRSPRRRRAVPKKVPEDKGRLPLGEWP